MDDPPVAVDDTATTPQNTAVTINVLANDSDPDGDALSVISFTQPSNGAVTLNGTTMTYTPAAPFTGIDSFTYSLAVGVTATVRVTVQGAAPTMHVSALDGTATARGNSGQWAASVTVTVVDQTGTMPVSGATVTGTWSGATGGTTTGLTGTDGKVILTSLNMKSGTSATFTVNNVTHGSYTYDPVASIRVVVVNKP